VFWLDRLFMHGEVAVRPPRQARTRASWERVLDAGVAILAEHGYGGLTIGALCERSRVTPPTIYARAANKEALLLAVYDRAMQRVAQADRLDPDDEIWRELPSRAVVRELVVGVVRIWTEGAAVLRPIVHRAAHDPEVWRRGTQLSVDLGRRFRAILLARPDVVAGADAERRADACYRIVYAALVQRVMYGPQFESDMPLSDDELLDALVEMAERYLGIAQDSA
jgi:AcrR family transcriptional regulator